ncbi:endogenous retrovirus group PABLB member 1 Env polyprotein-like [Heterodontus francisci]|uniref:endogenous retrovirus group PABLB member 1 Env polyprotein-like n=1 Tax=Heterodontus francisci TaxID=7792 RepID=UPI00355AD2A1
MAEWVGRVKGYLPGGQARKWQSADYSLNAFAGWKQPDYNRIQEPPFLVLTNTSGVGRPQGLVCIVNQGNGSRVGWSTCRENIIIRRSSTTVTVQGQLTTVIRLQSVNFEPQPANLSGAGETSGLYTAGSIEGPDTQGRDNLTAYNDTYFICGHKAYPWLPEFWTGSCYLGYVIPYIRHLTTLPVPPRWQRMRRATTETERFFAILFPWYGTAKLARESINMASVLEKVANDTSEALVKINAEMVAIWTVALQNRMALDFILAEKGGTCALIGFECCTYIPDSSEITILAEHIRKEVEKLKQPPTPTLWGWATRWLGSIGTSMVQGLIFFLCYNRHLVFHCASH